MTRGIPRFGLMAAALAAVLLLVASLRRASAGAPPAIPVKWNAESLVPYYLKFRPTTAAEFEQVFHRRWEDDVPSVVVKRGGSRETVAVKSCAGLLKLKGDIWDTVQPLNYKDLALLEALCGGVERMPRLKPSRVSNVRWEARDLLPGLAAVPLGARERGDGPDFTALSDVRSIECRVIERCKVLTAHDWFVFYVVASCDFNGDGIEDLMVIFHAGPQGGTLASSHGLILSRLKAQGPLTSLDAW